MSLAACASGVSGAPAKRDLASSLSWEPNGGHAAAFSPDGARVAFLSSTLHTPPDLWLMNADGTGKRRLTTRGASSFRWSADGRAIELTARRRGYEEVLSVNLETGREEPLPKLPPNAGIPIPSPDGSLFAFTAPGQDGIRDLWVGTADRSRVEAVTEKIHVRSFFWASDGRKICYEPGKTYGLGLWEIDLSTMESRPLIAKYIGTPSFSEKAGRVAYPYPTGPGAFEVHTMKLDGTGVTAHKAPRLGERWLAWASDATAVHYLGDGGDSPSDAAAPAPAPQPEAAGPHGSPRRGNGRGVTALWRLDLETGAERRVSPPELHVVDFSLSPDGRFAVATGALPSSRAPELFRIDLAAGEAVPLAKSRPSAWMPTPSPDATRVAYVTNEGPLDAVRVAGLDGKELAAYPGFALERDARMFWLPRADGLLVFSARGLHAFSESGPVAFPGAKEHRGLLHADVALGEDKVALSAIPRYGETPGLYVLEAVDGSFVQRDLRHVGAVEDGPGRQLQPRWSNDGLRVAFTDGADVWTVNADGTSLRRLTAYAQANRTAIEAASLASFPVWSVRGRLLAFTLTVYAERSVSRELWIVDADGSSPPRRVFSEQVDSELQVFLPEYTSAPFFDPSDRRLIATAVRDGVPNVVSIDVATGKATALTEEGAVFPAMLPEEDAIVFTSLAGNDERLWIMNADGSAKRLLLNADPAHGGAVDRAAAAR